MAQAAQVTAKPRPELGSRANKRLRDAGFVPGVIYGHKEAVVTVTLPKKEVVNHLNHGAHLFDLSLEGKSEKVLVKEVQYDHLGSELIHVDFARGDIDVIGSEPDFQRCIRGGLIGEIKPYRRLDCFRFACGL